ncbi:MAG TPA: glycosyltransferase family 4 protein [Bacilli bacterium]|nr:glycosyltransferase family 4 protein [Bacilli bacterium]
MRVLIICTEKLPMPPVRGGAIQTYIYGILPQLAAQHDITVLGSADPSLPEEETQNGVHYVRKQGGKLETYRDGVAEYLREHGSEFDLIQIYNRPRLVATVKEHAPQARITLSMHNDMFHAAKIDPEEGAQAVRDVERIITISDYIGQSIVELFPEAASKVRTIYSGVDLDRYQVDSRAQKERERLRNEYGIGNKKVILFVGRLSKKKGADILVRAMTPLAKKHPDAALVLVGSRWFSDDEISDYVAYVRAIANRSPIPVITTGYVPNNEVHKWFWAGDLFVCPSQWQEPLARVHYEAMAAELPILTTARGGNPEVIRDNGAVVDQPEDPDYFAQCISSLLSDRSRLKQMGRAGRQMAESHFSWDRVAREVLDVWE